MSENSNEPDMSVTIALYPEDGQTKALRQIAYGIKPFILFELEAAEDGDGLELKVVGSLIDTNEELVETLEAFLDITKSALEQHAAAQGAEVPE